MAAVLSFVPVAPKVVTASPSDAARADSRAPDHDAATARDERFGPSCRLCKTDEYSSVFAFRRACKGRLLIVHYRPNERDTARLGVVVAKKFAKRAPDRNLVKRIVREHFRRARGDLPPLDLVIRLHAPLGKATRAMLHDDVAALLRRVASLPAGAAQPRAQP